MGACTANACVRILGLVYFTLVALDAIQNILFTHTRNDRRFCKIQTFGRQTTTDARARRRRQSVMLRLKSRSVLCTPSSGLSRALGQLNVDTPRGATTTTNDDAGDVRGTERGSLVDDDDDDLDGEEYDEEYMLDGRGPPPNRRRRPSGQQKTEGGNDNANAADDAAGPRPRAFDFNGCSQSQGGAMGGCSGGPGGSFASQETFGGPDFITPADAQFDAYAGYDSNDKENFKGARSPCALSPTRNKRPRFGLELGGGGFGLGVGSQGEFGYPASQPDAGGYTQPSQSQGDFGGFRVPRNREPPASRSGRSAGLPRAATSPPCARNAFLPVDDQPAETSAHGRRANCTSAAQLATMSRFRADFVDLGCIARGGFSKVHKVIGRLDGCHYALKRTDKKLQTERERNEALREVQVMASLTGCPEIVRYHSAWWENDHLYIQMELGSTVASKMVDAASGQRMDDATLLRLVRDVSAALTYAHARGIAHMDIKPDNIFTFKDGFKLGDWGRVAQIGGGDAARDWAVDEGDARYLPSELLNDDFTALDRADVFSLGATLYELALGTALPSHGAEYQALRQGQIPRAHLSDAVYALVVDAMAPKLGLRPSAAQIFARCPASC